MSTLHVHNFYVPTYEKPFSEENLKINKIFFDIFSELMKILLVKCTFAMFAGWRLVALKLIKIIYFFYLFN